MADQALDARSTITLLRRYRLVVLAILLLGAAAGVAVAYLRPPVYTSVSVVLLPSGKDANGQLVVRDPLTEARIASSDLVLGPAGKALEPPMTATEVRERIRIDASTNDVITIEASAASPALAEALAAAVARAEIRYVADAASTVDDAGDQVLEQRRRTLETSLQRVTAEMTRTKDRRDGAPPGSVVANAAIAALAQLTAQQADLLLQLDKLTEQLEGGTTDPAATATEIQAASPATRPKAAVHYAVYAAVGAAAALLLVLMAMSAVLRNDRRLRLRDEIADAVGSPVVASVHSQAPRSVAGWTTLMQSYEASTVDAWSLRLALRQLVPQLTDSKARGRADDGDRRAATITVVSLDQDNRALAIGPQLASYAATSGLRTRLVAAQRHESAASLWAACHRDPGQDEVRPGLSVATGAADATDVDLTVVVVVIDRRKPEVTPQPHSDVTLVCVSPGKATADDLARVAVEIDDAGHRIAGVVVADPDGLDRTSGRLLQADRVGRAPLPTLLTGGPRTRPAAGAADQGGAPDRRRAREGR
ncbi:Wzz/FepE/Etk N-terminal domain-containing protein [Nocardioides sp. TF02-7]|uniref:Wzz/FepE/Etk N-terminal domain-containing protein n=1 Tax=Nocardioides sp. TF02-7 TaxID=2917724 RepID=UPI001F058119|nr:Wzz/FepE/Etk N-terminal domain-containing protein [Nocardioides sp. TF02-7]UMG91539.1 Wzz/FepE/Etk N-terminal domain-containing protein [Nocardioides sp. TF02-7]